MSVLEQLRELANDYSISPSYTAGDKTEVVASEASLRAILSALGVEAGTTEEEIAHQRARHADAEFTRPLPRFITCHLGDEFYFPVHVHDGADAHVTITCEDGSVWEANQKDNWTPARDIDGIRWGEATFALPTDLPEGWHTVTLTSQGNEFTCGLVVTPAQAPTPTEHHSGVMAQLYSLRSSHSWGIGDFHDLKELATLLGSTTGADFLLINPLHAAQPNVPLEDSPYLPFSRRFLNPLYLSIEDVPEYANLDAATRADIDGMGAIFTAANKRATPLTREPIYTAKLLALRELYYHRSTPDSAHEQAFAAYKEREGTGLTDFAAWCADYTDAAAEGRKHALVSASEEETDFYAWLQFLCDEQLAAAQQAALDSGMAIGLVTDLAVGVHPDGADAANLADVLAGGVSVGASPDGYNPNGQNWSQPPWHPYRLAESGYAAYRDMLRSVLAHAGAIRIDHVLGLFRLFWIPRDGTAADGAYVRYDYNALLSILALEAKRAGAYVVGEDLGTFDPWIQETLADYDIMGTSVVWFEGDADEPGTPKAGKDYRRLALTSTGTHDLAPTAGMLTGESIRLRAQLGLIEGDVASADRGDAAWQRLVVTHALTPQELSQLTDRDLSRRPDPDRNPEDILTITAGLVRFVESTPSLLTCTALTDLTGDRQVQNQPGTTHDEYPNWCIPLTNEKGEAVLLDNLAEQTYFRRIAPLIGGANQS
ncbi:MAG: 4-alpha-glucanotransferase [Corynebacterium sp.]|nr:4-alpha-glucanotransferase [Corynebacterium sp.]